MSELNIQMMEDLINKVGEGTHESKLVKEELRKLRREYYETNKVKAKGYQVISTYSLNDASLSVVEYDSTYVGDISKATDMYHAQKMGMKLRQLRVSLTGGSVAFDSGQFLEGIGNFEYGKQDLSLRELFGGAIRKLNDETFFRPSVKGYGELTLDSSFKFITLLPVEKPSKIVMEKGIYLASIGNFTFQVTKNLNPSYMLFSEKSIFQTDARGTGVIALELPVHINEIIEREVTPDKPLMVNGDYVLLRTGSLKRVVKPAGSVIGSLTSGTGLVEEYSGTGKVWVASTLGYHRTISESLAGTGEGASKNHAIREGVDEGKNNPSLLQKIFLGK